MAEAEAGGFIVKTIAELEEYEQMNVNVVFTPTAWEHYTNWQQEDKKIVKRKTLEMKPMDEEEAILELELLGHDFFIYKDVHTNEINLLYKRKDGNYGIIETNN